MFRDCLDETRKSSRETAERRSEVPYYVKGPYESSLCTFHSASSLYVQLAARSIIAARSIFMGFGSPPCDSPVLVFAYQKNFDGKRRRGGGEENEPRTTTTTRNRLHTRFIYFVCKIYMLRSFSSLAIASGRKQPALSPSKNKRQQKQKASRRQPSTSRNQEPRTKTARCTAKREKMRARARACLSTLTAITLRRPRRSRRHRSPRHRQRWRSVRCSRARSRPRRSWSTPGTYFR